MLRSARLIAALQHARRYRRALTPALRATTTATRALHTHRPLAASPAPQQSECRVSSDPFTPLPSHITHTTSGLFVDHTLPQPFAKILIANRGEIACRIIRTCRAVGVRTVAIYSDADAHSQHVDMADEAYYVGPSPASDSYLRGQAIVDIAKKSGAEAIHPGYGFLSENSKFARLVSDSGLKWIGPPPGAIELMGSKSASKALMIEAKVPVVPGYHGDKQDIDTLTSEAKRVGFPLMIKAVMGGGGKGMRIVRSIDELSDSISACQREAMKSFNDNRILMERYIERSRHIEFQVFADNHGNAIHLYERDCSIQRRHQKVLEEAPSVTLTPAQRASMGRQAVNAALAVNYQGAGTVEFIYDCDSQEFYFMEMNTRLQVEHPVTEMIVRKDLVQWQLHVAAGHRLPVIDQSRIVGYGHAIEARIYAENVRANFLPAAGTINQLVTPTTADTDAHNVRVETGIRAGDSIGIFYDPMISKLIAWGPDRQHALRTLTQSLQRYQITGVETNIQFLINCCNHREFSLGSNVDTSFIAQYKSELISSNDSGSGGDSETVPVALTALWLILSQKSQSQSASQSVWNDRSNKRFNTRESAWQQLQLQSVQYGSDGSSKPVNIPVKIRSVANTDATTGSNSNGSSEYEIVVNDSVTLIINGSLSATDLTQLNATINGAKYQAKLLVDDNELNLFLTNGPRYKYTLPKLEFSSSSASASGALTCLSPMAGKIVKVNVSNGQSVKKGDPLVIMEAMKMEHIIRAPISGAVETITVREGDFIQGQKVLVTLNKPDADATGEAKQ